MAWTFHIVKHRKRKAKMKVTAGTGKFRQTANARKIPPLLKLQLGMNIKAKDL